MAEEVFTLARSRPAEGVGDVDGAEPVSHDVRLGALFDAHHQRLYRLARRLAGGVEEARDLVQDTFLRAARSPSAVPHGAASEEAWLVRVLINLARDGWRKKSVRGRAGEVNGLQGLHGFQVDACSHAPDVESSVVASQTVWAALSRLAPRRRAAIVLYELDGLPVAEIAQILGVSAVTVRWHLSLGRREMAAFIEPRGRR